MKNKNFYTGLLSIAVALLFVGVLFRVMHWPHAKRMLIVGYGLICVAYPKMMLVKANRDYLDIIKGLSILVFGGFGIIYFLYFPENRNLFNGISKAGLIFWIAAILYQYLSDGVKQKGALAIVINILFVVGSMLVAAGAFYSYMHWPGAKTIMVFGAFPLGAAMLGIMFSSPEEGDDELMDES